jgi:proteasome assembly chaperone (PAC2) family protein
MSSAYSISPDFNNTLPQLESPLLVVMLQGWIDASSAAATAMEALISETGATQLLEFDADTFVDYRARRPMMELRDGVNTKLEWSVPKLFLGKDKNGKSVVLLTGPEPDSRWQHFAATVGALAQQLGVRRMLGLGAYPVATPHTRAVQLSCTSPNPELVATLPYLKSSLDVPALGLWAQVPHYVASMAYPAAAAALLGAVSDSGDIEIDISGLLEQATIQRERLDSLVRNNPEHAAMLTQLEQVFDEAHSGNGQLTTGFGGIPLPSGDELAAELEQFLREHRSDS